MNKKDSIIQTAHHLFHRYGYAKTSLEDIAKSLNIRKSGIYYYFKNKEDLFFQTFLGEWMIELEKLRQKMLKEPDPRQQILAYTKISFRYMRDIIIKFGTSVNIIIETRKLFHDTIIQDVNDLKIAFYAQAIQRGIEQSIFHAELDPPKTGRQILKLIDSIELHELFFINKVHPEKADFDKIERFILETLTHLLSGMRTK